MSSQGGLWLPNYWSLYDGPSASTLLNTATDKLCMTGHVFWDGEPASKVMSSAGAKIHWYDNAIGHVWANGASSLDIGIQDTDTSNGPPVRGDGTFDVKATLTGGSGITSDAWNHTAMSTGSKTIPHGQLVSLVFDLTARGGSDAIRIYTRTGPSQNINGRPVMTQFKSSAWANNGSIAMVYLEADDGTLGIFDPSVSFTSINNGETFSDSSNPDERGILFQVPFACTADAAFLIFGGNSAAADSTLTLYSDPLGTPVSMGSITILGENLERNSAQWFQVMFSSRMSLAANTDYCLAIKAISTGTLTLNNMVLPDAGLSKFLNIGGAAIKKGTRNNGSGAFTPENPAVTMYEMGLRVFPTSSNLIYPRSGLQGITEGMSR